MAKLIPTFEQLPLRAGDPPYSAWGLWDKPELGALNYLSDENTLQAAKAETTNARYAGVFVGQLGMVGNIPLQWAYAHNNLVGQLKKGLAMAMMTMGGAMSGILTGNVFRSQDAPGYRPGLWVSIVFNIIYAILVLKNMILFGRENRRAERGETVIMGQPGYRYTL